ncbi:sensor histidine kinase [Stackebrandtia soli]|uniref:sensor histidine kinase n=1 Tax=Stackebrandtia soli TaxID=1892856 RepID=UPI0039EA92E2
MAIKTRLILAMAALLCAATIIIGTVAITAVTTEMTSNIDAQLYEYMEQADFTENDTEITSAEQPTFQQIALIILDQDQRAIRDMKAGFADTPLPLPDLNRTLPEPGVPVTVTAEYGSVQYRILTAPFPEKNVWTGDRIAETVVAAVPMTEVERVRQNLFQTMVYTALVVLTVGIIAAWWITRRGLRPVNYMIDAASAVAGGDLRRRLPAHSQRTEIGKLATALNIMVSKLVGAITERDTQQARLRRFVADASHELRTPLAAISGYAELYESGGTPPGPALDRAIGRILSESQRMASLVDDLLLLARLDQVEDESASPVPQRIDLVALVSECVDDARAAGGEHPIELTVTGAVTVAASGARLRQVISNLLSNARIHTPPSTSITVTVARHTAQAVVTVHDDGPGIPPEHRHRVFDRFYRADDSRSRETGGTGLGLAIVKSIVESSGGRVELASQLGKGTTVRVILPVAEDTADTN